ncbi:MAG: RagB/SusD family nutrient uptake outer membrane protein [Bacteroides sp.]|nr:RagB/SusD family nutrient uptake outer membrane protein [Bacteroides sp.]
MVFRINKIKNKLGILLFALLSFSCQDWLDVSPETEVKYDDLFSYKNGFKDQLTGVYTAMCAEGLYGAHLTFGMVDALGQQYYWKTEAGTYYHLHRFEYENSTSEGVISGVWNDMYNTIANINILLKALDEHADVLSVTERDVYKGEALALRAFLHFDLLRLFGKSYVSGANEKAIPYVESISKEVPPLKTVAEVCDLAIKDLTEAVSLLEADPIKTGEETTTFLGTRSFHFNYYAARALMARVYLYKNEKSEALNNALEVIESGKYPWVSRQNVATGSREERDGIFLPECIFMLNNTKLKTLTEAYLKESENNTTGNLLVMDYYVVNEIFEADKYGGTDWRYTYYFDLLASYYYGSTKLFQVSSTYNNRQPLLRLSEMYLIAAECSATKEDALEYLNLLRQHRGFDESNDLTVDDVPDDMLQNVIGKEYRKEFIGEGQWFFYCKRTDQATLPNVTVPFSKEYYVLPMPDAELEY